MFGRIVFVTGSSTGIGEAIALHFARLGDTVYATMRTPDKSGETLRAAAEVEELDLTLLALDVNDDHSVARAIGAAMERSGRIDVLVNNAGLGNLASVEGVSMEDVKAVFETNVFGPLRTIQAVLPAMRERRSGTIVNITSIAGLTAGGSSIPYAVSKAALNHLTRLMANVLGPEIRVNAVAPGLVETPWTETWDAVHAAVAQRSPLGRSATADDCAEAVLGILRARYQTGDVVVVDGGLTLA